MKLCTAFFLMSLFFVLVSSLGGCSSGPKATTDPISVSSSDPWFRAARTSDIAMMQGMIDGGVNVNAKSGRGLTGLMVAARTGSAETVRWLLDKGADASMLDDEGQSALVYALVGTARGPKLEKMVEDLLQAGAKPFVVDKLGFQPVLEMMELGLDAQVRKLTFTDKKPCDLVPKRTGEPTLARAARLMEKVALAEFLEAQGCW